MITSIRKQGRRGFTLLEVMTVVFIVGILLAIALPSYARARDKSGARSCVSNLRQVDWAKERFALDHNLANGDTVSMDDLVSDGKYIKSVPFCSRGGTFTVNPIGTAPTCSVGTTVTPEHQLP